MSIDWNKVKSNAKEKDDQQYAAMKEDTVKRGPYSVSAGTSQPSGFTPAQKSELTSLENQRRQAQVDMDIDTMNALDARMKAIRASAGQQTFGDRADENFSGWVKGTAAAYSKTAEDALNFVKHLNTVNSNEYKAARQEEQNAAHYQEMLDRGTWDNGKPLTDADRAQLTTLIRRSGGKVKAASDYLDKVNAPVASAAEKVGGFGDRMTQESVTHNEAARTGATALEKILLDTGNVAADVTSDIVGNLIMPGLGTAGRVTRLYGSGSRAAEEKGLGGLGQFGYGATKAALGEATNRMFSGNPILEKATGKGALDDILFPGLERTLPGAMFKGGFGEAVEETAENLADIPIQKIFFGDKADQVSAKDIGYDALIASIIGGLTGISGKKSTDTRDGEGSALISQNTPAGDMPVDAEGNSMGATENAVQGVSGANNPPAQGTGYAATELGRPSSPLGVSATQEDTSSVAPSGENASVNMDPLLELLTGGKRVDQTKLTNEQFDALADRGDIGMDAGGRVYQVDPAQHIDQRSSDDMGNRRIKAFQYDHPEIQPYYKEAAAALLDELSVVEKGGQIIKRGDANSGEAFTRTKRGASERISSLLDDYGLSYNQIETALNAIINDKGQENIAAAKRVEFVLDEMLTNGYQSMYGFIPANQDYISAKNSIAGSQAGLKKGSTIPDELDALPNDDGLGAADAGFTTQGMEGEERTSRFADSNPYNQYQEAATGLNREDYAKLFRYQSQTEQKSMYLAEELLYLNKDGNRTFIRDIDEASYQELAQSLRDATAWNGPQMDAAYMIKNELQGRSVNMEIPSEEYTEWLSTMREHETAGGQGVQANAKWTRNDNQGGKSTELDAWKNLEESNLSDDQKQEVFRKIVQWDMEIEGVKSGDTASLKDIILRVGQERGVLNALTGQKSKVLTDRASKALDSLTFEQLKQFAYSSTAAMSTDSNPANTGQKLKTIQILNMLSAPKTPVKNLTGNTSFYGIDAVAMDGAAILDMAVSKLTGTRSVAFERAALGKESLQDAVKAMQMSIAEITLDVDMGGEKTRYGTGSSRTFKASGNFMDKVLSTLERNQSYLLTATDEFYKGAARGTAKATQSLIDQGKIKTTDKEYAAKQADQLAKYRTFQDDTKISVAIQQIHDILNLAGVGDSGKTIKGQTVHAFGAGDIVAPFTRVAGNLVSRGLEYSPLNAAKGAVEIAQQVANASGGKTVDVSKQAKGVSNMARGMTGTAIAYGFMMLAKSGLLRQAEDEADEDVAALNQSEGMTGTQLNLSAAQRVLSGGSAEWRTGDTLVDLSSIEPLNLLMNLGTEMAKSPENPIVSSFKSTMKSFGDASAELPVLQSIGQFGKDVMVYKKDWQEAAAEQAGKTIVSSVTPNILSALAKGLDDRPRNVYTGDGLVDIIKDSFKNRVPGLRETLPGSVNTMGEEKTYQGGKVDNLVNALISPVGVNTYTQSEVSKEMQRVRESTGDATFYPTKRIPSELEYTDKDGKKHVENLSYEERQEFQGDRGTYIMTTYADVMGTGAYKKASDEQKKELLNLAGDYAYQLAKANVLGNDAASKWVMNAKNAKKDLGISTGEFIALYQKYGSDVLSGKAYEKTKQAVAAGLTVDEYAAMKDGLDADGNGGVSQAEAQAYLDGQGFTNGQKADLWSIINSGWKKNPYK